MKKKVWIIILNRNWLDDTIECIESFLNNSYKSHIKLIVIDNWSDNNEWSAINEKYKSEIIFIQNEENLWFTGGCNVWIHKSNELWFDYWMLFNNDAVIMDWVIENLLDVAESDPSIWIVWPAITYYDSDLVRCNWWSVSEWTWLFYMNDKWKNIRTIDTWLPHSVDYVCGCAFLVKRQMSNAIWLLDDDYFAYCEEVDYCRRARKLWWKTTQVPHAVISHKVSASSWAAWWKSFSRLQAYLMARNALLFGKKNLVWIKKFWFLVMQYLIKFPITLMLKIRSISVLIGYIEWLLWIQSKILTKIK